MNLLIVIDMQNDFVTGSLGSMEARAIVGNVARKVDNWDGPVIFTRDTHHDNYMSTLEGAKLPVAHCIEGTDGWQIVDQLAGKEMHIIDKPTFGSTELAELVKVMALDKHTCPEPVDSVTLVGLCTDICVISNALLLRATLPDMPIIVDSSCCAGVSVASHHNALEAMKMCQIDVV